MDKNGIREEQEQQILDAARADELRKIGREEARAETASKKAAAAEKAKAGKPA